MSELIKWIESKLLPFNCQFSTEQQAVIVEKDKMDVVAGPGTGKTTVLTARIKFLLEEMKDSNQGICILTHTNVAVDEIKNSLKKLGVDEIKNPHFIGTIQDFFNTFFGKKAFHLVLGDKKMRVLDDDLFREYFNKEFKVRKPSFYREDWDFPNPKNKPIEWNFNNLTQVSSMVESKGYKKAFDDSIASLFQKGIVTNECCLELSKWYIEQYSEKFNLIISKRFSYLLLDEVQDTSKFQFNLISTLFDNTSVIIQKFGDPYQSIYNIWENNSDLAWQINENHKKQISKSSRFSENILEVVKNVCIEKYDDFHSNAKHTSFSPYFIVFESGEELIRKYSSLIDSLEQENETFKKSNRAKMIVSVRHEELENIFGNNYKRDAVKKVKQTSKIKVLSDLIYRELYKAFDSQIDELFKKDDIKLQIFNIFKGLKHNNIKSVFNYLKQLIDNLVTNGAFVLNNNIENTESIYFKNIVQKISEINFNDSNQIQVESFKSDIALGTIHSVKGETHKATLMIVDSVFRNGFDERLPNYSLLKMLRPYLLKDYNELPIVKNEEQIQIEKALKLAYVALSRPTHLACIGIPRYLIEEDSDLLSDLRNAGWNHYE